MAALRGLPPRERIAAVGDAGSVRSVDASFDAPRPSPHLARWGIGARDDDGIVVARISIDGASVLIASQDERFLAGSTGENHADTLRRLFELARVERPAAVVLLAASGGVRLHEANAAEWALARALAALLDLRADGIAVLAIGVGDVFGGASVLACAAERIALLPAVRLGLSGPKVIEATRGRNELDADDTHAVAAVFGADARAAAGHAELLPDSATAIREWIARAVRESTSFTARVRETHERLGRRLANEGGIGLSCKPRRDALPALPANLAWLFTTARPVDEAGWLARNDDSEDLGHLVRAPSWLCRPIGAGVIGPREAHEIDSALMTHVASAAQSSAQMLLLIGDSRGHEVSLRAEALCLSQYLAHHAAVLALLRARGVRLHGLLSGVGHSAELFANVLQATELHAFADAQVVAMEPAAVARVTRLPHADLLALIENDPLLGQPVRHFARFAGMDIVSSADIARFGLGEGARGEQR